MAIIFMGLSVLLFADVKPAYAGKKVWEEGESSLTIFGDMRLRIEQDDDSNKDDTRDRWRIRLRPGMKFVYNKTASVGFRLRTATGSIQSPHQTLEVGDPSGNQQFGVDRAFFKLKFAGFYVWGGKNAINIWNPGDEALWDDDLQPEGLALGFKQGGLHIGLSRFIINEAGWGDDNTLISTQVSYGGGDNVKFKVAAGALIFNDGIGENGPSMLGVDAINPGGESTLTHVAGEIKITSIKLRAGASYTSSNTDGAWGYTYDDTGARSGAALGDDDKTGVVAWVRGKAGKVDLRVYYWDMGYAAQPALGKFGQDNFPFTTNFTGYHLQVGYKFFNAMSADFRVYIQSTKNEDIKVWNSNVVMQGERDRTRYQINLNFKF